MNEEEMNTERDESQLALKTIQEAERSVIAKTRGPVWRTALATLLLAVVLLGNWMSERAPLAEPVTLVALIALFTLSFIHFAALRQKGIRMRLIPSSTAGKWLFLGQVIVYISLIKGADWLLEHGHSWGTWAATALICIGFAITLHFYPTSEPVSRLRNR
jgi:phosphatidylglycerophosphate synthase